MLRELGNRPLGVLTGAAPSSEEVAEALELTSEQLKRFHATWFHDDAASWPTCGRHERIQEPNPPRLSLRLAHGSMRPGDKRIHNVSQHAALPGENGRAQL